MGKYQDIDCPICHRSLDNGDEINVCPECGAPYHRTCIQKTGACVFPQLHEQGKSWEAPKQQEEKIYAGPESGRCSRCGSKNPPDLFYCEVCGEMLQRPEQDTSHTEQIGWKQEKQGFGGQLPHPPYPPFTTPFGGVGADEEIGDLSVKDLAVFIGPNSFYYIPRFKLFHSKKKSAGFNFSAAFFQSFFFLYRKMFFWGILLLILQLLLAVPSLLMFYEVWMEMMGQAAEPLFAEELLLKLDQVCSLIRMVTMVLCGVFGNRLYQVHCHKKMQKIKQANPEHKSYMQQLRTKGGVSVKAMMILLGCYFAASTALTLFLL